ncbi:MAG: adenylate/guanylate cyclase domain-containing protein [Fimbriimonadaceae bacterium]
MADEAPVKTFVFTDIADSSSQWEREPTAAMSAIEAHGACVRRLVEAHGGTVVKCLGDGYAAVFSEPWEGLAAAVGIQADSRTSLGTIVRVGVHSGLAVAHEGDFQGTAVNRAARIASLAHPGQTLVSATTFGLAADVLGNRVEWRHIGETELRGHERPEDLWQADSAGNGRSFPPPQGVEPDHNLVSPEREMVGRGTELQALAQMLATEGDRFVTLLGFGGMGKSLLANYAAWNCVNAFDAVWWAGLELCRTEEQARAAIAASAGDGSSEGLVEALSQGKTLLVLDCCDALGGRLAGVAELLGSCPGLHVLATSRSVIGLSSEHLVELRGLDTHPRTEGLSDAAKLFVKAAEFSGASLGKEERKVLTAVVQRLEGNPLAILLAAGRLRAMSFDALARRVLDSPLRTVRSHRTGGRHDSLRHVVESSMSLLDEVDREWTVRMSVFQGPFWLEDVMAVFEPGDDVEDAMLRLRDNSLLVAETGTERLALRQPDPVREFARELAEGYDLGPFQAAHAEHYATLADEVRKAFDEDRHDDSRLLVNRHIGNLRAGFAHACSKEDAGLVARYVRGLARTVAEQGMADEFEAMATAGASAAAELGDSSLECELLGLRGIVARRAGRAEEARAAWLERASKAAQAGDPTTECDAYGDLADLALAAGEIGEAREYWGRAAALADRSAASDATVWADVLDGRIALAEGDTPKARQAIHRVEAATVAPDQEFFRLRSLSELARAVGDPSTAQKAAGDLLRAAIERRHAPRAAQALWQLLACHEEAGDAEAAEAVMSVLARLPRRVDPTTWRRVRERGSGQPAASLGAFWALAATLGGDFSAL